MKRFTCVSCFVTFEDVTALFDHPCSITTLLNSKGPLKNEQNRPQNNTELQETRVEISSGSPIESDIGSWNTFQQIGGCRNVSEISKEIPKWPEECVMNHMWVNSTLHENQQQISKFQRLTNQQSLRRRVVNEYTGSEQTAPSRDISLTSGKTEFNHTVNYSNIQQESICSNQSRMLDNNLNHIILPETMTDNFSEFDVISSEAPEMISKRINDILERNFLADFPNYTTCAGNNAMDDSFDTDKMNMYVFSKEPNSENYSLKESELHNINKSNFSAANPTTNKCNKIEEPGPSTEVSLPPSKPEFNSGVINYNIPLDSMLSMQSSRGDTGLNDTILSQRVSDFFPSFDIISSATNERISERNNNTLERKTLLVPSSNTACEISASIDGDMHTDERKLKVPSMEYFSENPNLKKSEMININESNSTDSIHPFCKICGKLFFSRSNFKQHLLRHYERKFKCQICNFSCLTESALKRHMLNNDDGKNFECNICRIAFSRKYSLHRHLRRSHGIKSEASTCIVMKF
ncbi:hypothetical protein NPIL_468561 [Nephila pilipes]|uniref:C2H2-type domain-containing protein n=1 Tax=Nephila pilipes TaxID=299642 RepID=A0A8X6TRC9_NEPPI|nr:hypothetical protein NPIL_468561 [Nephila pilipes]